MVTYVKQYYLINLLPAMVVYQMFLNSFPFPRIEPQQAGVDQAILATTPSLRDVKLLHSLNIKSMILLEVSYSD